MSDNPLISFLLITYNQELFIVDALESALKQTYEPLEIVVSDDCSTDNTFVLMENIINNYKGRHSVVLNKNKVNNGLAGNINQAMSLATGEFFVMAAGDDLFVPERTTEMVDRWLDKENPVDLVCSYFKEIDDRGKETGYIKKEVLFTPDISKPVDEWLCGATGACAGYSRKLYDKYGDLDSDVIAEDWIFSFRAWLESDLVCIEKPLVMHRTHDNSISVEHKNVKKLADKVKRQVLMTKAVNGKYARAKEWLKAWDISGRDITDKTGSDLKKWVNILEIEKNAYNSSSRFNSMKIAIESIFLGGGIKTFLRIVLRCVLKQY